MHRFILALSCFLIMLAAPISAQDVQKGYEAYQNGDYATALKEWTPLAEGGDSVAQYNLGLMYHNGWGVPQDYKEAIRLYTLAAGQGYAMAQTNLGAMYGRGDGVSKDNTLAYMWYHLAAEKEDVARRNKSVLAEQMLLVDIHQAKKLALRCKNNNYRNCDYFWITRNIIFGLLEIVKG